MMATMHGMPSQIELYEEMSILSSRMVDAARASEWDNLIELEYGVTSLRNTLLTMPEESNVPAANLVRKRALIRHILENDAEVRRHTEPWMERILYFLGNGQPHRELHLAPAAGSGESAPPG